MKDWAKLREQDKRSGSASRNLVSVPSEFEQNPAKQAPARNIQWVAMGPRRFINGDDDDEDDAGLGYWVEATDNSDVADESDDSDDSDSDSDTVVNVKLPPPLGAKGSPPRPSYFAWARRRGLIALSECCEEAGNAPISTEPAQLTNVVEDRQKKLDNSREATESTQTVTVPSESDDAKQTARLDSSRQSSNFEPAAQPEEVVSASPFHLLSPRKRPSSTYSTPRRSFLDSPRRNKALQKPDLEAPSTLSSVKRSRSGRVVVPPARLESIVPAGRGPSSPKSSKVAAELAKVRAQARLGVVVDMNVDITLDEDDPDVDGITLKSALSKDDEHSEDAEEEQDIEMSLFDHVRAPTPLPPTNSKGFARRVNSSPSPSPPPSPPPANFTLRPVAPSRTSAPAERPPSTSLASDIQEVEGNLFDSDLSELTPTVCPLPETRSATSWLTRFVQPPHSPPFAAAAPGHAKSEALATGTVSLFVSLFLFSGTDVVLQSDLMSDATAAQLSTPPNSSSTSTSVSSGSTAVPAANQGTWPRKITLKMRRLEPTAKPSVPNTTSSPVRLRLKLNNDATGSAPAKPTLPTKPAVIPATLLPPEIVPVRPTTTRRKERYQTHSFQIRMYTGPKDSPAEDSSDDDIGPAETSTLSRKKLKLGTPASPQSLTGRGPGIFSFVEGGGRENSGASSSGSKLGWRRGRPPMTSKQPTHIRKFDKLTGGAAAPRSASSSVLSSQSSTVDKSKLCGGDSHETAITISDSEMSISS